MLFKISIKYYITIIFLYFPLLNGTQYAMSK